MGKGNRGKKTLREKKDNAPQPPLKLRGGVKCPVTGVPIDPNVCLVNKTRGVRGCPMCLEVGI